MLVSLHCLHVSLFISLSFLPSVNPHQWQTYPCDRAHNTLAICYLQCSNFKVLVEPIWGVLFCCAWLRGTSYSFTAQSVRRGWTSLDLCTSSTCVCVLLCLFSGCPFCCRSWVLSAGRPWHLVVGIRMCVWLSLQCRVTRVCSAVCVHVWSLGPPLLDRLPPLVSPSPAYVLWCLSCHCVCDDQRTTFPVDKR